MIGQTLGSYRITARVARGGQATLYRAVHVSLGRDAALKILHPHLISEEDFRQKFEAEGRILAQLQHPNIVAVYDAGVDQGHYYIAMEWLDGEAVDRLIEQDGKLPVDQVVRIADQVAAALEYAHAQGLIHRDIKPGNIMLLPDGTVKVLDFGIAAMVAAGQKAKTRIGTMEYMALEHYHGQADQRSDIYSLGASLYHMLVGECPPLLAAHPPKPLRQDVPAVPASLETLIHRTLARDPNGRPQNATQLRQELGAAMGPQGQQVGTSQCPNCGSPVRAQAKYCSTCGQQLLAGQVAMGQGPLWLGKVGCIAVTADDYRPRFVWSPEGDKLVILGRLGGGRGSGVGLYFASDRTIGRSVLGQCSPDSARGSLDFRTPTVEGVVPGIAPRWSMNGKEVLYVSMYDQKVWRVLELKGEWKAGRITWEEDTDDGSPVKSPDGKMLLYRVRLRATGASEWRLMNLGTRRFIRLQDAMAVAWSPDSDHFVAVGRSSTAQWQSCDLYIHDRSGQLVSKLTGGPAQSYYAGHVEWLDGYRLLVRTKWTGILPSGVGISLFDIRRADATLLLGSAWADFAISPDRQWIATEVWDSDLRSIVALIRTSDYTTVELRSTVTAASALDPTSLGRMLGGGGAPSWSPDSTKVLFTRGQEIWAVNINDTGSQFITKGYGPQWSPLGDCIAFLRSPQQSNHELWGIEVEQS